VAQFGRGVMEDVSRRIVNDMAACIKANVEAAEPGSGTGEAGIPRGETGEAGAGPGAGVQRAVPMQTAKPINALGLLFSVLWARLTGRTDAQVKAPVEPLDSATAGIGALLALSTVVGLALAAAVVVSGVNAILNNT
jgi:hypothetical protein